MPRASIPSAGYTNESDVENAIYKGGMSVVSPNRSRRRLVRLQSAVVECLEGRRLLSVDALDPSFGSGGTVKTRFAAPVSSPFEIVLDAEGRSLFVGEQVGAPDAEATEFALRRSNANGTPDSTFGVGGRAVRNPDPARRFSIVSDVAVLPDGKILAAGIHSGTGLLGTNPPMAVARYNADGTPDLSFGVSGVVFRQQEKFFSDPQMAVQKDGKIVMGAWTAGGWTFFRFNADGSLDDGSGLDTTPGDRFGAAGTHTLGLTGLLRELLVQPDGKIVIAGLAFDDAAESRPRMTVIRLNADGTSDASFDGDGLVTLVPPAGFAPKHNGSANDLALRPDGRLLVGGLQQPVEGFRIDPGDFVVYSLNIDGSLDTTFGTGGRVSTSFAAELPDAHQSEIHSMALRPDGVLVAAGTVGQLMAGTFTSYSAIAAYAPDGSIHRPFGTSGKVVSRSARFIQSVALDMEQRLVTLGGGVFPDMVLARYFTHTVLAVRTQPAAAVTTELFIPGTPFQLPYGFVGSFVIERAGDLTEPLTLPLLTAGTATASVDFHLPASVTFDANQKSVTVPVTAIDDYLLEGDETVSLRVPPGFALVSNDQPVTVRDNEGPDRFEANDTPATATVHPFGGRASIPKLSIHTPADADWFRFTTPSAGRFVARISFQDDLGDLRLELYNDQRVLVATSDGKGDSEQVATDVRPGTTLYISVLGSRHRGGGPKRSPGINPDYDLAVMVQPRATIDEITPHPRRDPVDSVVIRFTSPVAGLDLSDLVLTRGGRNLLTDKQTLTTTDGGLTWVLGNLSALTEANGRYVLALRAADSGIVDAVMGTELAGDAFVTWVKAAALPSIPSSSGRPLLMPLRHRG
jgi:uncharacterized delta-60 repeat protein